MINIETGKVVDMLNSRDCNDVMDWLKKYPNIEVVCRDGSIAYAKAIASVHPAAAQISDLKDLSEIKRKYAYKTKWELILAVKSMKQDGYTTKQICEVLGVGNKTIIKYCNVPECEKEKYDRKTIHEQKLEANRYRKEALILEIKQYNERGYNISQIVRAYSIDRKTVRKHIESDGTFIHVSLGASCGSKLDVYKDQVEKLLRKGFKSTKILQIIKESGFEGSKSTLRDFIRRLIRIMYRLKARKYRS